MKKIYLFLCCIGFLLPACKKENHFSQTQGSFQEDSLNLVKMIQNREKSMIDKNLDLVMPQFSEDATWINSQGYLFAGKKELEKFHLMFTKNDSLDYYYEIGTPKIRFLDRNNALAYYSWKMFWFKKENPADTTFKEIGLMTLNAQKQNEKWKWVAVTNQHTPWFYDKITPVNIE
ncbi:nuclear transport factor 2 family protein [Flagellimonas sp. S3867]|uniref:nuclear transport factor 2 family protein n=1 Tax=Flagellimonas sp. S3867 TaxID=2768063 RepID=UPI00168723A2|nr:nuclear transport factor 2 family protein [Flagellimonas sp. S3867]